MPPKLIQKDGKNYTFIPGPEGSLTAPSTKGTKRFDFTIRKRAKVVPMEKKKMREGIVNTLAATRG